MSDENYLKPGYMREKPRPRFDGATYSEPRDGVRLNAQLSRVYVALKSHRWLTLDEIAAMTGDPPASVSARIRDLRKSRFGSCQIEREHRHKGLHAYRLKPGTEIAGVQLAKGTPEVVL